MGHMRHGIYIVLPVLQTAKVQGFFERNRYSDVKKRGRAMKKTIRILLLSFILTALFSFPALCLDASEMYSQQYESSGAGDLPDTLPDTAQSALEKFGISPSDPASISGLTPGNVFHMIRDFIATGGKKPLSAAAAVLAVILLCALIDGIGGSIEKKEFGGVFSYVSVLSIAAMVLVPLLQTVADTVSAIKGCSVFMLAFVPVYAAVLVAGGKSVTAMGFQPLLLGAAQAVSQLASFVISPLVGMYLAVNISTSVTGGINLNGVGNCIKKVASWMLTLVMTLFVGLLGVQTAINSASDGVAIKTSKFLVGSFVPVVGSSLGDALTTVQSCLSLLKSSVAVYAVVAIAAVFLPVLLELLLWRAALLATSAVADIFSMEKISGLLRSTDSVLAILIGIVLCIALLFLVSVTVVVLAGGSQ